MHSKQQLLRLRCHGRPLLGVLPSLVQLSQSCTRIEGHQAGLPLRRPTLGQCGMHSKQQLLHLRRHGRPCLATSPSLIQLSQSCTRIEGHQACLPLRRPTLGQCGMHSKQQLLHLRRHGRPCLATSPSLVQLSQSCTRIEGHQAGLPLRRPTLGQCGMHSKQQLHQLRRHGQPCLATSPSLVQLSQSCTRIEGHQAGLPLRRPTLGQCWMHSKKQLLQLRRHGRPCLVSSSFLYSSARAAQALKVTRRVCRCVAPPSVSVGCIASNSYFSYVVMDDLAWCPPRHCTAQPELHKD